VIRLTRDILENLGARYVFCLMNEVYVHDKSPVPNQILHIVPKYTVGWTDMEIKDAPPTAVIPFCFLNGSEVVRSNIQLIDLKLLEKFR
jgi:hypothetical protein